MQIAQAAQFFANKQQKEVLQLMNNFCHGKPFAEAEKELCDLSQAKSQDMRESFERYLNRAVQTIQARQASEQRKSPSQVFLDIIETFFRLQREAELNTRITEANRLWGKIPPRRR